MTGSSSQRGGSHAFSAHPQPQQELERLRRQALAAWPRERCSLQQLGLVDGLRVVDVGCGPGYVTRKLRELNATGEIVGLEPDPALARVAAQTFEGCPGISLHVGSMMRNDLPAAHFDFAYVRFVLQHVVGPVEQLRALSRLLRPGGKAVLVEIDDALTVFHPQPPELARIMGFLESRQVRAGGDRRIGRKLPHLLDEAGFADVGFQVLPFTSQELGHGALLELAVTSRLARIPRDQEPGIHALADRMKAFFDTTRWHGVACIVATSGVRPIV